MSENPQMLHELSHETEYCVDNIVRDPVASKYVLPAARFRCGSRQERQLWNVRAARTAESPARLGFTPEPSEEARASHAA